MGSVYVFVSRVTVVGRDRYGAPRLGVVFPKRLVDKIQGLHGREVVVVILERDDSSHPR